HLRFFQRDVPLRALPFSKCLVDEKRPAPAFLPGRGFFAHTVFGAGRKRHSGHGYFGDTK
ncbi:hypothetical protein, partial [Pseudomonas sp. NPDC087690]|uniref:hypothetical protein n=1 Tax=Pseudomonas sp. NPDC087690 TaxID=3364446 RepID=UPI00381486EB